jgi:hypothetical protein
MPESIQNCSTGTRVRCADDVRRRFIVRAAELYDRSIDVDLAELDDRPDAAALLLAFPWLGDAELVEALWALGEFEAGGDF